MTNDELLAKLLDNSLSDAERQELSARMAAQPQFAEEVREYLAVEDVLKKTVKVLHPTAPASMFDRVEHITAASIAAAAGTTTAAGTSGISALAGWTIAGISSVLVIGASLLYFTSSTTTPPPAPVPAVVEQQATPERSTLRPPTATAAPDTTEQQTAALPDTDDAPHAVAATSPRQPMVNTSPTQPAQQTSSPDASEVTPPAPDRNRINAGATANDQTQKNLAAFIESYKSYSQTNDRLNMMLTAKNIGLTYRTLREFENSRHYLSIALDVARQLNMEETEAVLLGELGLTELERGAEQEARKLIEDCVTTLQHLNSSYLARWQDALRTVQAR